MVKGSFYVVGQNYIGVQRVYIHIMIFVIEQKLNLGQSLMNRRYVTYDNELRGGIWL